MGRTYADAGRARGTSGAADSPYRRHARYSDVIVQDNDGTPRIRVFWTLTWH